MKRDRSSAASSSSARARPRHSAEQPAVIKGSAAKWTISASLDQVEVPKHKQTHTRPMPLPFTIDAWIMGKYYERRQYLGHGNSKVCYWLTERLVLKLCRQPDQEPDLFQELQETGVFPKVHASAQCQFGDQTWHAWMVEQAKPLDQILKENPLASNVCIPGAVRAMLVASSRNHILSDNALFNFGMVNDNVVIIDAGSRSGEAQLNKGTFNRRVMRQLRSKAQVVIHPEVIAIHRQEWCMAGNDMVTALQTYETRWQELRSDCRHFSVLNSLEERKSSTGECPYVATVLDSLDPDTLDWLTQTYLWGELPKYGPSSDGYTRRQDSSYTAAEKLEQLIAETHERRVIHCNNPAEDIVNENQLLSLIHI